MSQGTSLEITPLERPPDATVSVPGSKSISNRALLLAALADGRSELSGMLFSDDTRYMSAALRQLGVCVDEDEPNRCVTVVGCAQPWPVTDADLFVGNAGTAMRFLLAALCLGHGRYRIDGTERMRQRPIQDLVDALVQLGARGRCERPTGCPPVIVEADGLPGGEASVAGDRSSQFLSALLQVAPYAGKDVVLHVTGTLIARPYADMTIGVMESFGVSVERDGYREFRVRSGQRYRAREYAVEPDASAAHYFLAAAALTGGRVRVTGLGRNSLQGDIRFADVLAAMGARVDWEPEAVTVTGPRKLMGVDVDMNDISDTSPTLAVLGAFADGEVTIRNIRHVRWQESDRLQAVAAELRRIGVDVKEREDGLSVRGGAAIRPAEIQTYDDHRIAMSFALAGLRVAGIRIANPACVAKTFPDYFNRLEELRR